MVTVKIGGHTVEMYDAIDELPVVRFHKYQKFLLVDAGIGSDIEAFDQRTERARRFLMTGKADEARKEIENLRQAVHFIQSGISPRHLAFAVLVRKLDGRDCVDISDDALSRVTEALNDAPVKGLTAQLDAVKKKIDDELMLYFPAIFNDSGVKEYYDLLRRRTMAVLEGIIGGVDEPERVDAVENLTTLLLTYTHPQVFTGSDGVEVQFDRQFETLCLALGEQLHMDAKRSTVSEFYNAFDFVQEKARRAKNGAKSRL